MASFITNSGKILTVKDIYDQLKINKIPCYYHHSFGTKNNPDEMNEPYGAERMFFNDFDDIDGIEQALTSIHTAGANGYLVQGNEVLLIDGKTIKIIPDTHIYTTRVNVSFDMNDTQDIFDNGEIHMTIYFSPRDMLWYDIAISVSRNLNLE